MLDSIPTLLLQFVITSDFSFIVGLEFHSYNLQMNQYSYKFGSTGTFVMISHFGDHGVSAIIIASGSYNLLKAIYAAILARNCSVMAAVI